MRDFKFHFQEDISLGVDAFQRLQYYGLNWEKNRIALIINRFT